MEFDSTMNWSVGRNWLEWTVRIIGASSGEFDMVPIALEDRGLWLDGKNSFAEIDGLNVQNSLTLYTWVKPHGSGTIFEIATDEAAPAYIWALNTEILEFTDYVSQISFRATEYFVSDFLWT
jgi:hypothetical protein